jgi:hypothetical protein
MWGHYGSRVIGVYLGLLDGALGPTIDLLWWYRLLSMEDCAPSTFLRSLGLVALYLCSKFHIFDRPILEEYVFQVEKGQYLLQLCFCVVWDNFLLVARKMHVFFQSLAVIDALGLQAFLMNIHHDTSFRSILKDDSISITCKAHIHFCLGKGVRLWLIARPFIYSFHIAHSTFILTLYFCLNLI